MSQKKRIVILPLQKNSGHLFITIVPSQVNIFRFLLEAHDNLGFFTVLNRKTSLLKVVFSQDQEEDLHKALAEISSLIPLEILTYA